MCSAASTSGAKGRGVHRLFLSWVSLIHRGYELAEFGWMLFPGGAVPLDKGDAGLQEPSPASAPRSSLVSC
jgi:hypothetical protein